MTNTLDLALLVDDHDISNFVTQNILLSSQLFKRTLIQPSGFSAINYLKENSNNGDQIPDLILLDISMPTMDGYQFLWRFEEMPLSVIKKAKIVILTGTDHTESLQRWIDSRIIKSVVLKPLNREKLEVLMKEV